MPKALDGLPEDVWTLNLDGSGLRRLTPLGEDLPSFAWSGDERLIYVMGSTGLWQVEVSSGTKKRLMDGIPHGEIAWAPPAP